jgi:hypothetical protein
LGRSDEAKQASAERKAERAAQKIAARNEEAVGQAEAARAAGHAFFQIPLEVSRLSSGRPDLLGQIEEKGWHLEHVGYVFIETGSTSTNMSSVESATTEGVVTGVYLFRAI